MIERVRHIGQRHIRAVAVHPLGQHRGDRPDARGSLPGDHQRADHRLRLWRNRFGPRRLLDDDVGVGAADPEGRHACSTRPVDCGPRHSVGGDGELCCSRTCVRGELGEVQVRRDVPVVQAEHGLDEAGDAGGVLQVAQVGLDRPQHQRRRLVALAENLAQRVEFDRVAQRGARAVRLDVVDLRRLQPRRRQRRTEHRLLGRSAGHRLPAAWPVLVDGGAAHQGQHAIPVAHCITEALEYDDAAALAANIAIGGGVESLTLPVGRQHAPPRAGDAVSGLIIRLVPAARA